MSHDVSVPMWTGEKHGEPARFHPDYVDPRYASYQTAQPAPSYEWAKPQDETENKLIWVARVLLIIAIATLGYGLWNGNNTLGIISYITFTVLIFLVLGICAYRCLR